MGRSIWLSSWSSLARCAVVLTTLNGCVSRQCPDGETFASGTCSEAPDAATDTAEPADVAPVTPMPVPAAADPQTSPDAQTVARAARDAGTNTPTEPSSAIDAAVVDAGKSVVHVDAGSSADKPEMGAVGCDAHAQDTKPGAAETCNGKDDDCDGKVDENADTTCSFAHAQGACVNAKCVQRGCLPGFANCNAIDEDGCEQPLNVADNCGACRETCDEHATCAATETEGLGRCTCDAPSFGDGKVCQGLGPIAAGVRWTCGIDPKHHAKCYGNQNATLITKLPATREYAQLALASSLGIGCGITPDQRLDCWNAPFSDTSRQFVQVIAGEAFACGLTTELDTICWSFGGGAQFGEASPPDEKFVQLAAGPYHACGLRADGKAVCWGAGSYGRVTNCPSNPDNVDCGQGQPPDQSFVQITAGRVHTCGLKANGKVKCWGIGVTADPGPAKTWYAQTDAPEDEMSWISAGAWHTCGLRKSDHTAVCWGAGVPGFESEYDKGQGTPPDDEFRFVAGGYLHTCGVTLDDRLVCWGDNSSGQAPAHVSQTFPETENP